VCAQGIISGTLFSYVFLFSAGGSFASAIAMIAIHLLLKDSISAIGISLSGSMASSFAQLLLARVIIFGENAKFIAPILLFSGLLTGSLLGFFTEIFLQKSKWFKSLSQELVSANKNKEEKK